MFSRAVRIGLTIVLFLSLSAGAYAGEGTWTIRLEPTFMDAFGHDQHVLTIHRTDFSTTPESTESTAIGLDTESGQAYRSEIQYTRDKWTWGWDFLWFATSQNADLSDSGNGVTEVVYEIPDRIFSTSIDDTVYYRTLEDTDLAMWTFDLYGMRTINGSRENGIQLQFGVSFADFDNDYRAVAGVDAIGGVRIDASSNYSRMTHRLADGKFRPARKRAFSLDTGANG